MHWQRPEPTGNFLGISDAASQGRYGLDTDAVFKSSTHLAALNQTAEIITGYEESDDVITITMSGNVDSFGKMVLAAGSPGWIPEAPNYESTHSVEFRYAPELGGDFFFDLSTWWTDYAAAVGLNDSNQQLEMTAEYVFYDFGEDLDVVRPCDSPTTSPDELPQTLLCEAEADSTTIVVMVTGIVPEGMSAGEAKGAGLLDFREIPNRIVPDNAVTSFDEILGLTASHELVSSHVVKTGNFR